MDKVTRRLKIDQQNVEDILPLTPLQEGMLYHYLKDPAGDHYFEQLSLELSGAIDIKRFEQAWNFVVQTNEMLRTVFRWHGQKNPVMIILKVHKIQVNFYDLSEIYKENQAGGDSKNSTISGINKSLTEIKQKDREMKFDLQSVPFRITLCKTDKRHHELMISNHHILYDGWSNGIILREFFSAYDSLTRGKLPDTPQKNKFRRFTEWVNHKNDVGPFEFWKCYLKDFIQRSEISIKKRVESRGRGTSLTFRFMGEEKAKIERFVRSRRITLASLFYSSWGVLLGRYNNSHDIVFGTTVSGRSGKVSDIENIVGLFINTLPLRVRYHPGTKIQDLLSEINDDLHKREEYEYTSLVKIKEELGWEGGDLEIFDSLMVVENYPLDSGLIRKNAAISIDSFSIREVSHYDLTIGITMDHDIDIRVSYYDALFEKQQISQLIDHLKRAIRKIVENANQSIAEMEILSEVERNRLLYEFNQTATFYLKDRTLAELFEIQVDRTQNAPAVVFEDIHLSYKQLSIESGTIACHFTELGVKVGDIVAIIIERSIEMLIAMLGILKTGAAYLPIAPDYPANRIKFILSDSSTQVLVITQKLWEMNVNLLASFRTVFMDQYRQASIPTNSENSEFDLHLPSITPSDAAYVIYTSGTTGYPKGVLIEHRSVINVVTWFSSQYGIHEDVSVIQMSEYTFDASVNQIFATLLHGGRLFIVSRNIITNIELLRQYIENRQIQILHCVPGMLDELLGYDSRLKSLCVVVSGGERLDDEVKDRILRRDYVLYNQYGPTETTVDALVSPCSEAAVNLGHPIFNTQIYILDKWRNLSPPGVPGEIFISGDGLSRGYLNRVELTREKFAGNPFVPGERIYRSGDLGKWTSTGSIDFLGRLDNQVKIRGFRIEPGEIEARLVKHPRIKNAAVSAPDSTHTGKYLVAYIETSPNETLGEGALGTELKAYLGETLPGYMIPSSFKLLEKIPLTAHGKIDRKALPETEIKKAVTYTPPGDQLENDLVDIWSDVLNTMRERIGVHTSFFELGGHSLKAMRAISQIHKRLNIEVSLKDFFKIRTIRGIAEYIKRTSPSRFRSITTSEKKEYYVVSSAQKRLYILFQMDKEDTRYNMPAVLELEGLTDPHRLESIFKSLILRHEILRTSFLIFRGEPVQKIHESVDFELEYPDLFNDPKSIIKSITSSLSDSSMMGKVSAEPDIQSEIRDFIHPFDLSKAPLLRVGLIERGPSRYLLFVDIHHIISDGISVNILTKEFVNCYKGDKLSELRLQYKDYAQWQSRNKSTESMKGQEAYWVDQFSDEIPVLELPSDDIDVKGIPHEGENISFSLASKEMEELDSLAARCDATSFIILLATFGIFLSRIAGQEEIVIGIPVAGRHHSDLESLLGIFVNTLAFRTTIVTKQVFIEYVKDVRDQIITAFENQDYPFEDLVEKVVVDRDIRRNPLFDVMFAFQNFENRKIEIPGLKVSFRQYMGKISKFQMTLFCEISDDGLLFSFQFSKRSFKPETIQRFTGYITNIVQSVIRTPSTRISDIEILSREEKRHLVDICNNTQASYPKGKSIHRLFEELAEKASHRIAVVGEDGSCAISYRGLNHLSNQLARELKLRAVDRNDIVAIMAEPSLAIIIGFLAILKAGVAYLPIEPENPGGRILYMLRDSGSTVILTQQCLEGKLDDRFEKILIDDLDSYHADNRNLDINNGGEDPVYAIYTSGTTGKPKAVLLKQNNLLNYVSWFLRVTELTKNDRTVLTSSFSFDLGYTCIYPALLHGCELHIMAKGKYQSAECLLEYIGLIGITYIKVTPSLFSVLLESRFFSEKNLECLRLVVLGGEAIRIGDVEKALKVCGHLLFMNHYGPTEVTIGSIAHLFDLRLFGNYKSRPAIGRPIFNTKVFITDPDSKLVPTGTSGEICISGEGVARGYLNRPELTAEKFVKNPFHLRQKNDLYPETNLMYRTGDLGRRNPNGMVMFIGRIDQQIKIRGYRIELGEIERRLYKHGGVEEAVVVARQDEGGDQFLVAYVVPNARFPNVSKLFSDLKKYLSDLIPTYMIPSYFLKIDKIPLTENGKLDRKALPTPRFDVAIAASEAPRDSIDSRQIKIWKEILGRANIGIDSNFFELGGHSLKAVNLLSHLQKEFNIRIPLANLFQTPTIRSLSEFIKKRGKEQSIPIVKVEEKEYYPLSSAQKRIFLMHQMNERSISYNMPVVFKMEGKINKGRLEESFKFLIARHDSFRTGFKTLDGDPVQRIRADVKFEIEYDGNIDIRRTPIEACIINFIRPFDLSGAPLLRVKLLRIEAFIHFLMVDMHHIIADGTSRAILIKEFISVYNGRKLSSFTFQYRDYSEWQYRRNLADKAVLDKQRNFWLKEFSGEIAILNLPLDFPRPPIQSFKGDSVDFSIDETKTRRMKDLAFEQNGTLYMVLLAFFYVFLSKLSGLDNIIVGTAAEGRRDSALESVIGMFVNTLALRGYLSGEEHFIDFLSNVREKSIAGFENQDYQFEELVALFPEKRSAGRNPLFDVMFVMENIDIPEFEIPGVKLERHQYKNRSSKFDLSLIGMEVEDRIHFIFEYNTELLRRDTVLRWSRFLREIFTTLLMDPFKEIRRIDILSTEEKNLLLSEFNKTDREYPTKKTINELFEAQVINTPESIAIVYRDKQITYNEYNFKSNQWARYLRDSGIKQEDIICIMIDRSFELMVGIMAVLKAGCAYLPIECDYPKERIRYMLEDSNARLLLTQRNFFKKAGSGCRLIDIDADDLCSGEGVNISTINDSRNLAYVIYTSGSTGRPKGVMIEHSAIINLVLHQKEYFQINEEDKILQFSSICFDASVEQICISFLSGAVLVLIDKNTLLDQPKFERYILRNSVTHLHAVPSFLGSLEPKDTYHLQRVISGGDKCPVELARNWSRICSFFNKYGPTETTVTSIESLVNFSDDIEFRLPIGKPIANTRVYILDRWGSPVPLGATGELYISGAGLARGYLNRIEFTRERFVNDLYKLNIELYRTGDLCRWLSNGTIEFLGRSDQQLKVRGFRVESGEIENLLLKHDAVEHAVVMAKGQESEGKYLVAFIVLSDKQKSSKMSYSSELRRYLSELLPDYMVPSYIVEIERLPLTSSGKIDRRTLTKFELTSLNKYVAPRNKTQERLAEMWAALLGIEIDEIGIDDNFFELGGHSLKVSALMGRIHKVFGVKIPLSRLFAVPTIKGISSLILGSETQVYQNIKFVEEKEYYPLTATQKRFFVFQHLEPTNVSYNMPEIMMIEGKISKESFGQIFNILIERHECLRTSFFLVDGEPVHRVHPVASFNTEFAKCNIIEKRRDQKEDLLANAAPVENIIQDFIHSFDLDHPPLLRFKLVEMGIDKYLAMFDMHHIISDGVSMEILVKEILLLFDRKELPPIRLRYRDYAEWIFKRKRYKSENQREKKFVDNFEKEVLNLPIDFARPAVPSFEGAKIRFDIFKHQKTALKQLAIKQEVTLYILLLSLFTILLAKISGQENIVIGSPIAGRLHPELENILGLFINTLVLRNAASPEQPFTDFLKEVNENTLRAFDRQDYQYEELVERVISTRDTGRNPLYDVMFVLQNMDVPEIKIPGLKINRGIGGNQSSKFDLTLYCEEREELEFRLEYSTTLFKTSTIERFIKYFNNIIVEVLKDSNKRIAQIEIITADEKQKLLYDFNDTTWEFPREKTIHQLFREQVEKIPTHMAAMDQTRQLTYSSVNDRANQLACKLRARGITANCTVAIIIERSVEMILGILGILKSGGAYLPISTNFPEERQEFIIEESHSHLILSQHRHSALERRAYEFIDPGDTDSYSDNRENIILPEIKSTNLAYVIYTSGSTGLPKGVMIEHWSVVNRLNWMQRFYPIDGNDKILQKTPCIFDVSVWELFWWGHQGASVYLLNPGDEMSPGAICEVIKQQKITTMHFVPSMLTVFLNYLDSGMEGNDLKNLRQVFASGEALETWHVEQFYRHLDKSVTRLINLYGPTEATVDVTYFNCSADETYEYIPIGKPIDNIKLYVVDKQVQLQPLGIPGELCISGCGLARGYINRPDLTLEKFMPAPFLDGGLVYKTGDIARWLTNGDIVFLGRIDHQVKIRGFRIELGEIENRLLNHNEIEQVSVIVRESRVGDKYLCAYYIGHKLLSKEELSAYLAQRLPDYMIPGHFVKLEEIPLTPNGKVDRQQLPEPEIISKNYSAPGNKSEAKLLDIWSEVLGLDKENIGIDDNFFQLGGHSLNAAQLLGKIFKQFSVEIPISMMFKIPSIRALAIYIQEAKVKDQILIHPVEEMEFYPLSSAQKRLYVMIQLDPDSTAYNMPTVMKLKGKLDMQRVKHTFKKLLHRHEILRTSFEIINKKPVQRIHRDVNLDIEYYDLVDDKEERGGKHNMESNSLDESSLHTRLKILVSRFIRPFDVSIAPLLRIGFIKVTDDEHILMADMPHTISDAISNGILIGEIVKLYMGDSVPTLRLQYKDFSQWHNRLIISGAMEKQEKYWINRFRERNSKFQVPIDFERSSGKDFLTETIVFDIPGRETSKLRESADREQATMFMVLLSIFNVLLFKLSQQEDITVGTIVAGRRHPDLDYILGVFVNTLALRNYPTGSKSFTKFMKEVRQTVLDAFDNQDYQFEDLVEQVMQERTANRNPLFDALFSFIPRGPDERPDPGKEAKRPELSVHAFEGEEKREAKFDLILIGRDSEEELHFIFEYNTALFKKETIERFIKYFKQIVTEVVNNEMIRLKDIELSHDLVAAASALYQSSESHFEF